MDEPLLPTPFSLLLLFAVVAAFVRVAASVVSEVGCRGETSLLLLLLLAVLLVSMTATLELLVEGVGAGAGGAGFTTAGCKVKSREGNEIK